MEQKNPCFDSSKIKDLTKNCELFIKIFEEQGNDRIHSACCKMMKIETYNSGQVIIKHGEQAKDFFVILDGRVSVRVPFVRAVDYDKNTEQEQNKKNVSNGWNLKNKTIGTAILNKLLGFDSGEEVKILHPGDTFGELALISDKPRAATVVARSKVLLGVLSKDIFQNLLRKFSEKSLFEKIDFLQNLPLFKSRTRTHLLKISYYFSLKKYTWNQMIYKEGDRLSNLYIIKSGDIMLTQSYAQDKIKSINKHHRSTSHSVNLNLLKKSKGMILGIDEIILAEQQMLQSARCVSTISEVYVISKHDFDTRVYRKELISNIKESYSTSQELLKSRYLKSCSTERIKSSLAKLTLNRPELKTVEKLKSSKIFMRTRRENSKKDSKESLNNKLSQLLYKTRRTSYAEIHPNRKSANSEIFRTQQGPGLSIHLPFDNIFKTSVPENYS